MESAEPATVEPEEVKQQETPTPKPKRATAKAKSGSTGTKEVKPKQVEAKIENLTPEPKKTTDSDATQKKETDS